MRKGRVEDSFRNVKSKDGTYCPHISKTTAERITRYCHITNQNKTRFVERCINDRLDALEAEYYESLTKEELIALIMA